LWRFVDELKKLLASLWKFVDALKKLLASLWKFVDASDASLWLFVDELGASLWSDLVDEPEAYVLDFDELELSLRDFVDGLETLEAFLATVFFLATV
jgi:hypothetical protein